MRIPKISNYEGIKDKEVIFVAKPEFYKPTYVFYTDKIRNKFIKNVEKIVRSSLEYRELIEYLRESLGMTFCTFFNNVSKEKGRRVGIEIHHFPFSLYDIVNIVLRKREAENLPIDPLGLAEEVVKLHYRGVVGLIPLSTTAHQLFHRGDLFIPLQYVDKGFLIFYQEYRPYLKEYEEMLKKLIVMSKDFDLSKNTILKKHLIYLNNEGYSTTPFKITL
jgi:hypothetical protein